MIGIIDYGLGNIRAFVNIYKRLCMPYKIIQTVNDFSGVKKIILPGVGAFDHAMALLNASDMCVKLKQLALEERIPVLGICVGMQILGKKSEEGTLPGLGLIDGIVKKINVNNLKTFEPLPHMGWNTIHKNEEHLLFNGIEENERFYFLHSYYFQCNNPKNILASTYYGDSFCSVVYAENIYGIQCHPEKSHGTGILFLKNFGSL